MTVIDLAHLERQCGGQQQLKAEVLGLFLTDTAATMDSLEAEGDPAARRMLAHAIRGAALGIGAFEVAERAREMEEAGGVPAPAGLRRAMEEACAEIRRLLAQ
jgi:HPt (histidine-containing phosphotransfer) domain-containing protein